MVPTASSRSTSPWTLAVRVEVTATEEMAAVAVAEAEEVVVEATKRFTTAHKIDMEAVLVTASFLFYTVRI
jgi:hypothetical protein